LSAHGDDFDRCLTLLVDGAVLTEDESPSCFDDRLLLLTGDCGLLFEVFDLDGFFWVF
jgi:hypothetical protein